MAGKLIADAVCIGACISLHKKIPERQIEWFAPLVFIAIGIWGLFGSLCNRLLRKGSLIICLSDILLSVQDLVVFL